MSEQILGSASEMHFIRSILEVERAKGPEILLDRGYHELASVLDLQDWLDVDLFYDLVACTTAHIRETTDLFSPMQYERYFVWLPLGDGELGGFHTSRPGGYWYFSDVARTTILNPTYVMGRGVRTLELVRSFLHDSLHRETFRTFKIVPAGIAGERPIFRERYGINIRRPDGISFSSPALDEHGPRQINLNTLMDGVVTLTVARALSSCVTAQGRFGSGPTDVVEEILTAYPQTGTSIGKVHFDRITNPTVAFLEHWGGDQLRDVLLQAMLSGDLVPVFEYFDERTGMEGSWERLFRSADF
jgi:hypothetical protein